MYSIISKVFPRRLISTATNKSLNNYYSSATTYTSALSLSKLYPNSSLKLTTPQLQQTTDDKFTGHIPLKELDITYSRSSGPGGQNVNKVNTKVEVRFALTTATWLNDRTKTELATKFKNKITKDGYVVFRSDLTRSQFLNLADCLAKIRATVRGCSAADEVVVVTEETAERLRRRLERSTRDRLAVKRQRSQIKGDRRAPAID